MRIVTEGKKREEQGKVNVAKLGRDLSISREIPKIKQLKIIHFSWDIESLSGQHDQVCDGINADKGLASWQLCMLANEYGGSTARSSCVFLRPSQQKVLPFFGIPRYEATVPKQCHRPEAHA